MTNCEKMEGPITTVKGSITDYSTKRGYGNITLQITRVSGNWSGTRNYKDLDTVVTNSEGKYELTFIPRGSGTFSIDNKDYNYGKDYSASVDSGSKELVLGRTNIVNFKTRKLVNLKVNLQSSSSEPRNRWDMYVSAAGLFTGAYPNILAKDTILSFKVSRLSKAVIHSVRYDDGVNGSEIVQENEINVGVIDTTIQIIYK